MPITIAPTLSTTYGDYTPSDARQDAILAVGECKTPDQLNAARERIMYMGIWDSFIDKVCNDGAKEKTLSVIAEKVIADRAVELAIENNEPAASVHALEKCREEEQNAFIDMLTTDGLRRILEKHQSNDGMVRFSPDTDNHLVNRLLTITVPHGVAAGLIREHHGSIAVAFSYQQWAGEACTPGIEAEIYGNEAREWTNMKKPGSAMTAWLNSAGAHGKHALLCLNVSRSGASLRAAHLAEARAVEACESATVKARELGNKSDLARCQTEKRKHEEKAADYLQRAETFEKSYSRQVARAAKIPEAS